MPDVSTTRPNQNGLPTHPTAAPKPGANGPVPEPLTPDVLAQLAEMARLDEEYDAGRLDHYQGEYVLSGQGVILAHGRALMQISEEAEKLAKERGIPVEHIAHYFVPESAIRSARP